MDFPGKVAQNYLFSDFYFLFPLRQRVPLRELFQQVADYGYFSQLLFEFEF